MINISKILNDPQLPILCKKFPDLVIDLNGDLICESLDPNVFQIYTSPTWNDIDVLIRFGFLDEETNRLIYVANGGEFIGTKLDQNSEKFKTRPNIKDIEKSWLEKYNEPFIRSVMSAINSQSSEPSELEKQLLSINDQFRIYDSYLISNDDKVYMSDLEEIKEIVGATQIHVEGQKYNWTIKWFLPYVEKEFDESES